MRESRLAAVSLVAVLTMAGGRAAAQPVPAGTDIAVNAYTTGSQRVPRLAIVPGGGFVVVWHSDGQDGDSYAVQGRRYDAAGAPIGGEFQANTYTTGRQYGPFVTADRKGNFVVVWMSDGQDGDLYGIFGQRYDAAGTRAGTEFAINTVTTGYQVATDAAFDAAGRFTVVWTSTASEDGDGASVHAQRFSPGGVRMGAELLVNSTTAGDQISPFIGMRGDGAFVVVWLTPDPVGFGIAGQRFASDGARLGGEFVVNDTTTSDPRTPRVAMAPSGEFVVSWREADGSGNGIFARRFSASGAPLGVQFLVNSYTTGSQTGASVAVDDAGNFAISWTGAPDFSGSGIGGRRFTAGGAPRDNEFIVNAYTTGTQGGATIASDEVGNLVVVWTDTLRDGSGDGLFARRFGGLRPSALAVDTAGNGVLQPNEAAVLAPSWRNRNGAAQTFGGILAFTGPAGPTYALPDGVASYGTVADGASGSCTDCYAVSIASTSRPALHWDATATETITPDAQGQRKAWSVHVGDSFADVPDTNPFYRFIETLLHFGVTSGCGGASYCQSSPTTREQMAVFVLVAREGAAYAPPACGTPVFADVPASSGFCRWVEELARRSVAGGCGGGNYCPGAPVTREQMAVFVLRTLDPGLNPPACAPPNVYADVPETNGFCRWIEELTLRGVVSGCGGGNYCPLASVTREQMGVFLGVTFGLSLYGPS